MANGRPRKQAAPGAAPSALNPSVSLRSPDVMRRIAETAYYLWEKRGRPQGTDIRDWLEAEKIVLGGGNAKP